MPTTTKKYKCTGCTAKCEFKFRTKTNATILPNMCGDPRANWEEVFSSESTEGGEDEG